MNAARDREPHYSAPRTAVVEFNFYHDEVLPTVVYALNRLGVEPDVYLPSRAAKKNAFVMTPELRYRRQLVDSPSGLRRRLVRLRGTPARYGRYDLLIMNSVEPHTVLERASHIDLPTLAFVHNANLLVDDPEVRRYFASPAREPMLLGRHVAEGLGPGHTGRWMAPLYLGNPTPLAATAGGRLRLCVAGNVEYTRRDYASLLDAVVLLAAQRADFVVRIVGRSGGPDGRDFRARVEALGLGDLVEFTKGEIPYAEYLTLVATSDFILPLIEARTPAHAPYFSVKITSSMSMALGLGVIPIADADLARLYGVEHAAVTYQACGLEGAMRAAMEMGPADRAERVRRIERARSDALAASVRNVAEALSAVRVTKR